MGDTFRRATAAGLLVYGLLHLQWTIWGRPAALQGRGESYLSSPWVPVALAVAGACVCAMAVLRRSSITRSLACLTVLIGAGLCVYSCLFPLHLVSVAFEGARAESVVRSAVTGVGAALGASTVALGIRMHRRAHRRCERCGAPDLGDHGRPDVPRWFGWGPIMAIVGFSARFAVAVVQTVGGRQPSGVSWATMLVFVVGMVIAGTFLPLATVCRWGTTWPRWTGPLGGRPVPRMLVLIPAIFVGGSLVCYFGVAGMAAWISGAFGGPFLPLFLEMAGYTLWGIGLLLGAAGYAARTRRPCAPAAGVGA